MSELMDVKFLSWPFKVKSYTLIYLVETNKMVPINSSFIDIAKDILKKNIENTIFELRWPLEPNLLP